ncbi:MAG: hypothetical protein AAF801_05070 [Pseudomonadota bacterium]
MAFLYRIAFAFALLGAVPVQAQTFAVNLGDRTLGTMTFQRDGAAAFLRSSLNNTPLNLFNGTLDASSRPVRMQSGETRRQLLARSDTTRKNREVSVIMDGGTVTQVVVNPASENTSLSVAERVPAGVLDPVRAFGQIATAQDCPGVLQMYDGRRAVQLSPSARAQTDAGLRCDMDYRVIAGPGHLAPLSFKNASVTLIYDASGLAALEISTGPFAVNIVRTP